uniref:Family with sequence similarity 53 member B n=1 Tax=Gasterosteus aculeatus aculeatus TaxID=481459 RepID=G3NDJ2_GASAC|nr:protein FAM53B [Gasterosteus aculeatus aculeatus]XP_040032900.1 protein FAM53B [Gasterosteus aculeatus aculeatus]
MCVAMVIIFKKTLEKKGADVTSKSTDLGPFQAQTMTQGTALFSCGLMETSRWRELGHSCAVQPRPVGTSLESLWDVLPEVHESSAHWDWDVGSTSTTITSLLRDLSLTEAGSSHSTAPPSKRQCRSLSCSEELAGCRSPWRPQGSRVWTAVVKRRCHSGGSVQRGGGGAAHAQPAFPAVQRSSSFSLPARANTPGALPCPPAFRGLTPSSSTTPPSEPSALPPYLSHEPICLPEPRGPSPASSPDSTPELERRGGVGLARSRSQPCVGVKRRRPALDLAKMSEKPCSFHSLGYPGVAGEDVSAGGRAAVSEPSEPAAAEEEVNWSPGTTNGKDSEPLWAGRCSMRKDVHQLGGEIDIEQIERN